MAMNRISPQVATRLMNTLASWCRNTGITVLERNGADMIVTDAGGEERRVTLGIDGATGPYSVDVKRMTARKLSVNLAAFTDLQVALGFQPSCPVNRGPILDRKLSNGEDFDLSSFRHTDFRRVPNPSPEKLASYQWLINQAAKEFFNHQQWRCQDHGLEIDDLKSVASVWTVNFIGMYERTDLTQVENDKLLHSYLIQRFAEFRNLLIRKERNEFVTPDVASIAIYGSPHPEGGRISHSKDSETGSGQESHIHRVRAPQAEETESVGEELSEDEQRAIAEGAAHRAAGMAQELTERLAEMGHDKMVETLTAVMENDAIHPDARKEAEKRLERHAEECGTCAPPASTEETDGGEEEAA